MKGILISGLFALALSLNAQTVEKTYLFDFGGQGGRGTLTTQSGWNNISSLTEGATSIDKHTSYTLIDKEGNDEGLKLTLTTDWGVNGNSGGGGLLNPDADQLGDLALETATCDYIFNTNNGESGRSFVISGLDKDKGYKFTIFGSRSSNEVRTGDYIITGSNSWMTEMQVAGNGLGANGENQRTGDAPVSDVIFPDAAGNIIFWIHNPNITYVPLSCMKMEQIDGAERPALAGKVTNTYLFDFGSEVANRGAATTEPGWNNILANSGNDCTANTKFENIIDAAGAPSSLVLSVDSKFTTNGYSTGLGLPNPSPEALGDLAVETATYDYFFVDQANQTGKMTLSGLDNTKTKAYRFYIFASRKAADARLGAYRLEGLNSWTGAAQAAGNALDGTTNSQNENVILVSEPIFADASGNIVIDFLNGSKVYMPINCMKVEELSDVDKPDIITVTEAVLSGSGIADGETTAFIDRGRNTYELYVKTDAGAYVVNAKDDEGHSIELPLDLGQGINRITVNFNSNDLTVTPVTYFCLQGSAWGGWSQTGQEMNYIGNGKWNYKGELNGYDKSSDSGRINFLMNKQWDPAFKKVSGSTYQLAEGSGDDIPVNPGYYDITADLNNMTWEIANGLEDLDPYRITVMGSSVANGQGAAQIDGYNTGYAYQFDKHLSDRYESGQSENPFYVSNISINGNSSVNLLNRFDELERDYGKWVIYGISLGNEGIHEASDKNSVFNQWSTNMQELIAKARSLGKEAIVMNNYTRGDFVAEDYEYIKKINDEIAFWDVPSVNLLGAIDNGEGKWADGYQNGDDVYHPNTDGHTEFFYAMVPSMMDAMLSGKPLTMQRTTFSTYTLPANATIEFAPGGTVHSFTFAVSAKAADGDLIATIPVADTETPVTVSRVAGQIVALLPDNTALSVPASSEMDEIELSQNYIRKQITLTVNGETQAETEFEPVSPVSVVVGNADGDSSIDLGELMFYRSSMHSSSPFTSDGRLNKSSLEVYAPVKENIANEAMSTVPVVLTVSDSTGIEEAATADDSSFRVFSSRQGEINVFSLNPVEVSVVNLSGKVVARKNISGLGSFHNLIPGVYIVNNKKIIVK